MDDLVDFHIVTICGEISFKGRYRRALETKNWHYYEREDGLLLHFRKEHLVCVMGGDVLSFLNGRAEYEEGMRKEDKKR